MTVAHKNLGGSFSDFLEEEGILEECTQTAIKRVLAPVSYLWNEHYANNTTATCFFNEK